MTLQKQYQSEIEFLAYHDTLTRLPNRRLFTNQLEAAIEVCQRDHQTLTILLIDVDHFKSLNDGYGHQCGDELLQATAQILQQAVGDKGTVARIGGDEFVLFMKEPDFEQQLKDFIKQLQSTFEAYTEAKYPDLSLSLSVGMSQFPKDGNDEQTLMHQADQAMYEMKRNRKFR